MKKIIIVLVLAVVVITGSGIWLNMPKNPGSEKTVYVDVEEGMSASEISNILYKEKLIKSKTMFKLIAKFTGKSADFKVGTYEVKPSMSTGSIVDLIASGKTAGKKITVFEGMSLEKIARLAEKRGIVSYAQFINEAKNGKFKQSLIEHIPKTKAIERLEGFLYPDTYVFGEKNTAHEVIDDMLSNFERKMGKDYIVKAKKMKLTPLQLITVASIVEREAKLTEDKRKVASVIYNRLAKNMSLQMDSILSYIHKEDKIKASLEDTKVESDYNPYKNKGLPPGPICSPGKEAIEAAANPPETKYLYFVASDKMDGSNVFSEKYSDFLRHKSAFDKAYREYIRKNPGVR